MKGLVAKPFLLEQMDSELVPKVVKAIIDDNARAAEAREERRRRRERRKERRPEAACGEER